MRLKITRLGLGLLIGLVPMISMAHAGAHHQTAPMFMEGMIHAFFGLDHWLLYILLGVSAFWFAGRVRLHKLLVVVAGFAIVQILSHALLNVSGQSMMFYIGMMTAQLMIASLGVFVTDLIAKRIHA